MNRILALLIMLFSCNCLQAQAITEQLNKAVTQFETDEQMRHTILGLCVFNARTGKPVYEHNAQLGLAAASTQKLFTSVAAMDLLGKDYRYKTTIGYDGTVEDGILKGNLHIIGYGDPTLGSWRWSETKEEVVLRKIAGILRDNGIRKIAGKVYINDSAFSMQPIPGGWIWDDIGNYYGAGVWGINWHENQYDLHIQPGKKEGDETKLVRTAPGLEVAAMQNGITTGKKGSGDNAYIYLPPYGLMGFTQGTVPVAANDSPFVISGSFPNAPLQFAHALEAQLKKEGIEVEQSYVLYLSVLANKQTMPAVKKIVGVLQSPVLDTINYWFLRRSVNLFGEALVKVIAYEKNGFGETEKGVELVRDFWGQHGIEKSAIKIIDGSGLSPQNRVTADAEVKVLQYAKTRPWYNSFYNALPEYNGMKMKSGSVGGARAFAGYHTAKNGEEYVFSIIVNNYDGSSGEAVRKLYKVLDVLK
ncbi:MAG: D-alanyl-D-alanine carboxypeptidase/D-alanyl-D-alanine-endopeptidase [Chitinophagaceae bacterium]